MGGERKGGVVGDITTWGSPTLMENPRVSRERSQKEGKNLYERDSNQRYFEIAAGNIQLMKSFKPLEASDGVKKPYKGKREGTATRAVRKEKGYRKLKTGGKQKVLCHETRQSTKRGVGGG